VARTATHRIDSAIERVFREAYGQAVATLVRVFGDISIAEDAVQDAFVVAGERWSTDGIPPNPAGWIVTTARRRAIDTLRRSNRGRELYGQIAATQQAVADEIEDEPVEDDQLRLIFTCCHPALREEHQIALTLRLVGGLGVDEVARSFLVGEAAMAKRLVRAKYKIKAANVPYRIPAEADLPHRLRSVLAVLYLIYNTGADGSGRGQLRSDAIRLARSVAALMPDEPEVSGLLALMLLNESRMRSRNLEGDLVLLRDQDRAKWDGALISEGHAIVRACIRQDRPGPYQLQAAIQAVHCAADSYEATDWPQIVTIYNQLYAMTGGPVVALNRAIALAETDGPGVALAEMDELTTLDGYHLFHAARGTMLRRLGRTGDARRAFETAASLAVTDADRRFLDRQIGELASG